jgi:hypothetical protein
MYKLLIVLGVLIFIWISYSWISVRTVEEPKYKVVTSAEGYEIREYTEYIIAETTILGAKDRYEATNKGFTIIANYIFGNNTSKDTIAMTAPVSSEVTESSTIAMTVPVNSQEDETEGMYKISFVMPSKYTLETLPTPNDNRVIISKVPSRKLAVKRFSWSAKNSVVKKQEEALLSELARDSVETVGTINLARYNPPWTIPFMLRNEVQIQVK